MKNFHRIAFLVAFLLTLAACAPFSGGQPGVDIGQLGAVLKDAVQTADRDGDGRVGNRELRDAAENPMNWANIIGGVLGTIGVGLGALAGARAKEAKADAAELWDAKLHSAEAKIQALKAATAPKT